MIEKQYLANRVATANDVQLIVIVYEGLLEELLAGASAAETQDNQKLRIHTEKSREILAELLTTLQGDSEVAAELRKLYLYINQLITQGVNHQEKSYFQQAIQVLSPLYEGWQQLAEPGVQEVDEIKQEKGPAIVSGMTYGKGQLMDYVVNDETNRWKKG
ncbi:Flagellin-specific chaperone FliS-like protein [Alkaliphilus metalliredigens QYMF]|uniref:Flagellin-specific chaperone FliS-like protein n=1 Tax=Alkaliphilus metalliredigens (strain QYMF) TaxID=293826 RepID=A6TLF3_ALKMQ|nr:flagellar protein FliS [Alkaliphilus metalliredigens]ABR47021.1 Flagellin-specific chaperone FliS-like protein [Alkaliphilus metalliredigens QYMF]